MQELFELIYGLLGKHTCVIIPNFGGFVVNEKGATRCEENDSFLPPMKEIIFNQLLVHNDGLLVQELMKRRGVSFEEAESLISSWVKGLKEQLQSRQMVEVSDWGTFSIQSNTLVFVQKKFFLTDEDSFGLGEFYFPKLTIDSFQEEKSLEHKENTTSIRPFLIGTVAAVACLMMFHPLQTEMNSDAFLHQSSLMMANLRTEVVNKDKTIDVLQTELDSYKKAPVGFYLILGDFDSESKARQFVMDNDLESVESLQIISIDQRSYVSVASSMTKEDLLDQKENMDIQSFDKDKTYILSVAKMGN